jgi:hypothetical protein
MLQLMSGSRTVYDSWLRNHRNIQLESVVGTAGRLFRAFAVTLVPDSGVFGPLRLCFYPS